MALRLLSPITPRRMHLRHAEIFERARIEGVTERWRFLGWPLEGQHAAHSRLLRQAGQPPGPILNGLIICVSAAAPLHMLMRSKPRETIYGGFRVRASAEQAADARKVAADDGG